MEPSEAARVLGVAPHADWDTVRRAYRTRIRLAHPDVARDGDDRRAVQLNLALDVLNRERTRAPAPDGCPASTPAEPPPGGGRTPAAPGDLRLADDTLALTLPSDETYRLVLDAANDVGSVTYIDRSGPLIEILCRFVGEPATSLLLTFQGRAAHTEIHATAESIEDRPGPPVGAILDLLEDALRARLGRPT